MYALVIILLTGLIFIPLLSIITDANAQDTQTNNIIMVTTIAFCIGLIWMVRRGFVSFPAVVLNLFLFITITFLLVPSGAGGRLVSMYGLVVVSAGVLISPRWSLIFAGASILSLTAMLYIEQAGLVVIEPWIPANAGDVVLHGAIFGLTAVLVYIATRSLTSAISRAEQNEKKLRVANVELEDCGPPWSNGSRIEQKDLQLRSMSAANFLQFLILMHS
ncbi:MAG: hypothetical protein HC806_00745 [Anaerolineae bacterium]|nr:hypothetical protein [Anaerolineae bacterium]